MVKRAVLAVLCVVMVTTVGVGSAGAATGIDVASYQHPNGAPIDWGQVRGAGHAFAYVKATEGTGYTNPYFAADWSGIGNAGLLRGSYHFPRPSLPLSTAIDQARYYVSRVGTMQGANDLPPMLDLEEAGSLSAPDLVQWARTWLSEVERLTGRRPVIYTGKWFWTGYLGSTTALRDYRLWLSDYNGLSAPTNTPTGWPWTIWQYTSTGQVPGIVGNVDMNRFCCSDANLRDLAGGGTNPRASNPFGSLDAVTKSAGQVTVSGWTIDPDTTGPVKVHVYVNGQIRGEYTANSSRPDVGGAYPGWGAGHGYSFTLPASGDQQVCVYAINVGHGDANPGLGCRTVSGRPVGTVDSIAMIPGGVRIQGWGFDPDTTGPGEVHLYVNGVGRAVTTDVARPDVVAAYGAAPPAAGFRADFPGVSGRVGLCAWVINKPSGPNVDLGCRTVTTPSDAVGSFDGAASTQAGIRLQGWALDPDTASPVAVHFYDNGRIVTDTTANVSRPDVGRAYLGFGDSHGFDVTVANPTNGVHQICAYAISVGPGTNPQLGCRTVTVAGAPDGSFDDARPTAGGVRVTGWALDGDARTTPLSVRVTVDGGAPTTVVANRSRPDVGAAFPGAGDLHGFDAVIPGSFGAGNRQVCVTALGIGSGPGTRNLGCRVV